MDKGTHRRLLLKFFRSVSRFTPDSRLNLFILKNEHVHGNSLPNDPVLDYITRCPEWSSAVRNFSEWLLNPKREYDQALKMYLRERIS
jgi:hypothetical protein